MWTLDWDEFYPVYVITEREEPYPNMIEVNLGPEFIERYHRAWEEWNEVQNLLEEIKEEWKKNGT